MLKKILAILVMLYAAAAFAAVDVNKATAAELDSVKGIGPAISGKIIDERKKGAFKDWQDFIDRVKGVGENNAAKLSAEGLTVNGAPMKGAAAAKKETKAEAKADTKADTKVDTKADASAGSKTEKKSAKEEKKEAKAAAKEEKKEAKAAAKEQKKEAKAAAKEEKKEEKLAAAKPAASSAKAAASSAKAASSKK